MTIILVLLLTLALAGCASSGTLPLAGTPIAKDMSAALGKLADNKLLTALKKDTTDTKAWVATGADAPTDPLLKFKAALCPTSIDLATDNLKAKILTLQALLDPATTPGTPTAKNLEIILSLTKLRYSTNQSANPQAMIASLKKDIFERVTAVADGCRGIFPAKQVDEMLKLAEKAGILTFSGGAAAPFLGLLP